MGMKTHTLTSIFRTWSISSRSIWMFRWRL